MRSTTPTACGGAGAGARCSGRRRVPYPARYRARAGSRRYVQHLGEWYAQAHPTEDFAETFAVWLTPKSGWRKNYADWPALHKLKAVDELIASVRERARAGAQPHPHRAARARTPARSRSTIGASLRTTARSAAGSRTSCCERAFTDAPAAAPEREGGDAAARARPRAHRRAWRAR